MRLAWATLLAVVLSIIGHALSKNRTVNNEEEDRIHLNQWVVEIQGGEGYARNVVAQHGFVIDRKFVSLPDHYLLEKQDVPKRSKRSADHHTRRLSGDSRIKFAEQQHEKVRVKRGYVRRYNRALAGSIAQSTGQLNDPEYSAQWYINRNDDMGINMDMGVREAWKMGVTGKGILVSILDDGLEKDHPDLAENYEPLASYDFNDNDEDPYPRYDPTNENKHGTRCGGEVAMVANNNICGAGIAFNSRIGGLRILDGKVTDHLEGDAIGFGHKNIHITSASWGPNDDGRTLEGPGKLSWKGMMKSITEGRNGKGTIMVWAAGNGAMKGDNCNCDGYCSSIYTLSVSSASQHGYSPWYSEKCASTHAATYSSGTANEMKVVSADLRGKCTNEHSGTSAAAPMAAGILALVLEKNPDLTWRDVQHLVVITSRYEPLDKDGGWYRNGVGLCVSHAFGYGLMDAGALVEMADPTVWEPVGQQKVCRVASDGSQFPKELLSGNSIQVDIETDGCADQENEIRYLEHIQVVLSLDYSKRGNIYVEVESPSGTITPLMVERDHDKSTKGFQEWPLASVHTWGENPRGKWSVRVADRKNDGSEGLMKGVELVLYGTKEKPFYHDSIKNDGCSHLKTYPILPKQEIEEDPFETINNMFKNIF